MHRVRDELAAAPERTGHQPRRARGHSCAAERRRAASAADQSGRRCGHWIPRPSLPCRIRYGSWCACTTASTAVSCLRLQRSRSRSDSLRLRSDGAWYVRCRRRSDSASGRPRPVATFALAEVRRHAPAVVETARLGSSPWRATDTVIRGRAQGALVWPGIGISVWCSAVFLTTPVNSLASGTARVVPRAWRLSARFRCSGSFGWSWPQQWGDFGWLLNGSCLWSTTR